MGIEIGQIFTGKKGYDLGRWDWETNNKSNTTGTWIWGNSGKQQTGYWDLRKIWAGKWDL